LPSEITASVSGVKRILRRVAVADPVMERVRSGHQDRVPRDFTKTIDPGKDVGTPSGQVRVPDDQLRALDAAPTCLLVPEEQKRRHRELTTPIISPIAARPLYPPRALVSDVTSVRYAHARVVQLFRQSVKHSEHHDTVCAAIEARVYCGRNVMSAHARAEMREDDRSSSRECRREFPRTTGFEQAGSTIAPEPRVLHGGPALEIGNAPAQVVHSFDTVGSLQARLSRPITS
jgi:hypothetical protein